VTPHRATRISPAAFAHAGLWREGLTLAALTGCFLLSRPYRGVVGDSILYIGRGVAALDPAGVGQDPMWLLDGQMRFSAFPPIVERLIAAASPATAACALALTGVLFWLFALIALARALGEGRSLAAIVLACALFAGAYGAYGNIYFGEPIATPRNFAEAAVLLSLAALVRGKVTAFVLLSCVAIVLHPIMALAGVATGFAFLCVENRRWLWIGAALGVAGLVSASAGLPVFDRLAVRIDAQWLDMLRGPADLLFPTLWPASAWWVKATQAATVALAILSTNGATRKLFIAILLASGAALAFTTVFGDLFPLLLVAQAQPWRAVWLLAVAAPLSFAIFAPRLWNEGWTSRLCLALLVGGWAVAGTELGALLAVLAVLLRASGYDAAGKLPPASIRVLCLLAPALVCAKAVSDLLDAAAYAHSLPADARPPLGLLLLDINALAAPAALAIILLSAAPVPRLGDRAAGALKLAICVLAIVLWRQEWDPYRDALARAGAQPDLMRLLNGRPGPVLWIGGNQEAWYWAKRPNWAAGMQGNGIVFSRDLAALWFARMGVLRDLGWIADGGAISRRLSKPDPVFPDLSDEKLHRFCARPDAPAWIVAPAPSDGRVSEGGSVWRAPARRYAANPDGGAAIGIDLYAVLPCAGAAATAGDARRDSP
jgi:hypothetical protein